MMKRDDVAVQRWLIFGLAFSTTAAASTRLLAIFRFDGLSWLQILLLAVFSLLFFLIATSFWIACLGAYALWRNDGAEWRTLGKLDLSQLPTRRTALLVPVYHEDPREVSARIVAMQESLCASGLQELFDFFILSDSTDEGCRHAEQIACAELRRQLAGCRVFYRNRARNIGHKSGNIEDFCKNWGGLYEYMVVLDADSVMTGRTLVHLVQAMDANPRAALIQTSPLLIGGRSLFARFQQFASWVYGPMYAAGLARLQGPGGNYWGHNAIIRVRPFMESCGLPALPGRPPLGGEIMSHDFVEAALLLRAGWEVWLVPELDGSYETTPPTLIDHLKRDRRWCQGNLQHMKLLFAQGLRAPSRVHFALGIMSYLSSPLWLLLVILFVVNAIQLEQTAPATFIGRYPVLAWPISHTAAFVSIAVAALGMLYIPKVLAVVVMLRRGAAAYGGSVKLIVSVLLESVFSTLTAPIFMLAHTWFVVTILTGRNTRWGPQLRGGRGLALRSAVRAFAPHTIVAIVAGTAAWHWTPGDFGWYLPMLIGLALATPIGWLSSLPSLGALARRHGLLLVPSETDGLPIAARVDAVLAHAEAVDRARGEALPAGEALHAA
ncbi:MAG TPA: glucans biosynthesis glucosyltransferase MdoH [Pseudolabrys sp.]|nr:glucans biosynthesis glucosyltransferase MdoH [Pseudolabrys sp.]